MSGPLHSQVILLPEEGEMKRFTAVIPRSILTHKYALMHVTHAPAGSWYLVLSGLPCSKGTVSAHLKSCLSCRANSAFLLQKPGFHSKY